MPRCTKCGMNKPADDFYANGRGGKEPKCKACAKIYKETHLDVGRTSSRTYRERNIDTVRSYERIKAKGKKPKRIPLHESARRILRNAVSSGSVVKPDRCDSCGIVLPVKYIHGHHTDYHKPLDVMWLCASCHGKEHRIEGRLPPHAALAKADREMGK